jgi:hypothetical protein
LPLHAGAAIEHHVAKTWLFADVVPGVADLMPNETAKQEFERK